MCITVRCCESEGRWRPLSLDSYVSGIDFKDKFGNLVESILPYQKLMVTQSRSTKVSCQSTNYSYKRINLSKCSSCCVSVIWTSAVHHTYYMWHLELACHEPV